MKQVDWLARILISNAKIQSEIRLHPPVVLEVEELVPLCILEGRRTKRDVHRARGIVRKLRCSRELVLAVDERQEGSLVAQSPNVSAHLRLVLADGQIVVVRELERFDGAPLRQVRRRPGVQQRVAICGCKEKRQVRQGLVDVRWNWDTTG